MADELELIERIYHPKVFGKLSGKIPYDEQFVMLLCPHPRKLGSCARGVGKSDILIGQDAPRLAITLPYLRGVRSRTRKPMPFRGFLIASVKDQAFSLQDAIAGTMRSHDYIETHLSRDTTKTNIRFKNGAMITIRPATGAARGGHAQVVRSQQFGEVKAIIRFWVDEAWFIEKENFFKEVIDPSLLIGGPGSGVSYYSTPYGESGPAWEIYNAKSTGLCMQQFRVDAVTKRRSLVRFDPEICKLCMARYQAVRFTFPSYANPYVNLHQLKREMQDLRENGLMTTLKEEYLGIPDASTSLFFNDHHRKKMWDEQDELDTYALRKDGSFTVRRIGTDGDTDEQDVLEVPEGEYYLGIDPNKGIESRAADFASLALIEHCRRGAVKVPLRFIIRFKSPLDYFNGESFSPRELTPFMIALSIYLGRLFRVRKIYIDQGGGGEAYYWPLVQVFGEHMVEYIKGSHAEKVRSLYNLRSLIERNWFKAQKLDWLMRETRNLRVEGDALEDRDQVKIEKAKAWGTQGAEVDGLMAIAYACRGVEAPATPFLFAVQDQPPVAQSRLQPRTARDLGRIIRLDEVFG